MSDAVEQAIEQARQRRAAGDDRSAISLLEPVLAGHEVPPARACLLLARCHDALGDEVEASRWVVRAIDADDDLITWQTAARLARRMGGLPSVTVRRSERLALLGSYTTDQLVDLLWLAAARQGLDLEVRHGLYGQYRQDVLDPDSWLSAFEPGVVLLATHEGEVPFPPISEDPDDDLETEALRWTSLWDQVRDRLGAQVVQHTFAIPPETPYGHLAARLRGERSSMLDALNHRLGAAAGDGVALVDCERLAGMAGKQRWFDPRFWQLSKQAVGLGCLPLLARHTVGVVLGALGMSRKCIVLDLDGTLWGGVIGEDGLDGIAIGPDRPSGESFSAFQQFLLQLKRRGMILAVVSKNDEHVARAPFEELAAMRLRQEDIALFVASWDPKPDLVRRVAETLDLGMDALVFVDDNPVEREAVRRALPDVDVLVLPEEPSGYVRALASYPYFEVLALTDDDVRRTEQYRGRALVREAQDSSASLDDFLADLAMEAAVGPFTAPAMPRIAQLVNKTNQFNVTARRRSASELERLGADDRYVTLAGRLRDRFTDHGLVGVLIAEGAVGDDRLEIDTWLMSCRVIGRTFEQHMLHELAAAAASRGHRQLVGRYVRTDRNDLVSDLYARLGFEPRNDGTWVYDLAGAVEPPTTHIRSFNGGNETAEERT